MNLHDVERVLRILVGAVLLSLAFLGPKTAWGYLGLPFLTTGLSGRCPLYMAFGFGTRGLGSRRKTGLDPGAFPRL